MFVLYKVNRKDDVTTVLETIDKDPTELTKEELTALVQTHLKEIVSCPSGQYVPTVNRCSDEGIETVCYYVAFPDFNCPTPRLVSIMDDRRGRSCNWYLEPVQAFYYSRLSTTTSVVLYHDHFPVASGYYNQTTLQSCKNTIAASLGTSSESIDHHELPGGVVTFQLTDGHSDDVESIKKWVLRRSDALG